MAPFVPEAWQEHRHSLISGIDPSSFSARNFPLPVGARTGIVAPLAVGLETLHAAHAFASHRLPSGPHMTTASKNAISAVQEHL